MSIKNLNDKKISNVLDDIIKDGVISKEEAIGVSKMFDIDGNGRFDFGDIKLFGSERFSEIEEIFKKHDISLGRFIDHQNIRFYCFQKYSPKVSGNPVVDDPLFGEYLFKYSSIANISQLANGSNGSSGEIDKADVVIDDYDSFKADVLSVANDLGYHERDIAKMSIHDAVMLCGEIVASRMKYSYDMISEEEKKFFDRDPKLVHNDILISIFNGKDLGISNKKSRAIDGRSADKLFKEGEGICRNYAYINQAVFLVIKKLNASLKNTFMTKVGAEHSLHSKILLHAWNMVTTVSGENIDITFVDPTWLDTRSRTAEANPKNIDNSLSNEDIYNAMDEKHYGPGNYWLKYYTALIYFNLSKDRNEPWSNQTFATSKSLQASYRTKALEGFKNIIMDMLGEAKKNDNQNNKKYLSLITIDFFVKDFLNGVLFDGIMGCMRKFKFSDILCVENFSISSKKIGANILEIRTLIKKDFPELMGFEFSFVGIDRVEYSVSLRDIFDWCMADQK